MSFIHGISGIKSASKALDIISNNIANSQTIGFKSSHAVFSDIMSDISGLGVQINNIDQDFSNGNLIEGSNDLKIAILGNGFFNIMDENGKIYYSRNGDFKISRNKEIINQQNKYLLGYRSYGNPPKISLNSPLEKIIIPENIMRALQSTKINIKENLPSNIKAPNVKDFDITNAQSYNFDSQVKVYDSMGNIHFIKLFYVKSNIENVWNIYCYDETSPVLDEQNNKKLYFKEIKFDNLGNINFAEDNKLYVQGNGLNGSGKIELIIDFSEITQYGSERKINLPLTNGYGIGEMIGFNINDYGEIILKYSNHQNLLLGQIAITNFKNKNGLKSISDNCWIETQNSGSPIIGTAQNNGFGKIRSRTLENSNVDISNELVQMIVQQRNYQSSIQSIKVQDQLLQTLINIK